MGEFEKAENSIKHILQEFEVNLTEDTLENRMVLARIEAYSKKLSEVLQEARAEFPVLKPLEIAKYLHEVEAWQVKWLTKSTFVDNKNSSEVKHSIE
jgi:hypothetical protein